MQTGSFSFFRGWKVEEMTGMMGIPIVCIIEPREANIRQRNKSSRTFVCVAVVICTIVPSRPSANNRREIRPSVRNVNTLEIGAEDTFRVTSNGDDNDRTFDHGDNAEVRGDRLAFLLHSEAAQNGMSQYAQTQSFHALCQTNDGNQFCAAVTVLSEARRHN